MFVQNWMRHINQWESRIPPVENPTVISATGLHFTIPFPNFHLLLLSWWNQIFKKLFWYSLATPRTRTLQPRTQEQVFFDRFSDIFRSINVGSRVGFPRRRRRRRRGLLFCPEDLLQHTDKQIAAAAATGFPSPVTVPELANGGTRTLGEVRTGILIEN